MEFTVNIFSSNFSNSSGQGIERYAYELKRGLAELGVNVRCIEPPKIPLPVGRRHLCNFVTFPLKIALNSSANINHFLAPEFSSTIGFARGLKIVTFHDLITLICPETSQFIAKQYYPVFFFASKFANFISVDSTLTYKDLIRFFPSCRNKIKVIPLGVDRKFVPLENKEKLKQKYYKTDKFVIGYLGALGRRKRVDKLIIDFKKNWLLKNSVLAIWGKGKLEGYLKHLARNDKRIRFMGFAPEEEIVEIYNSFDAFVFPSYYEGFGLPIIEAVACGIPTFVYKDSHIPEEVKKYAFEIESIEEILEILENIKPEKLKKLSEKVKREFDWDRTVEETINLYKQLLEL